MKHFNEHFGNPNRDLSDYSAVPQITALHFDNCKIGENFIVFSVTEMYITVFTGTANSLSVMSIPEGHNFLSHFFKIHINSIVFSMHISSKTCLLIRHSG